jgi:hypothetical protein
MGLKLKGKGKIEGVLRFRWYQWWVCWGIIIGF